MAYPVQLSIIHTRIMTSSHNYNSLFDCTSLNYMHNNRYRGNSICDPAYNSSHGLIEILRLKQI